MEQHLTRPIFVQSIVFLVNILGIFYFEYCKHDLLAVETEMVDTIFDAPYSCLQTLIFRKNRILLYF